MLGLSPAETTCARRAFRVTETAMRERIELIGNTFLRGYHEALAQGRPQDLPGALDTVPLEQRGFAYEGAGMGLALLDCLAPWRSDRTARFLQDAGQRHTYMGHVGVGWVWARVPWGPRRMKGSLEPLLRWLAFDGWGFHAGFFHWGRYIAGQPPPRKLAAYEKRAFDQGLGRSWWFVNGGNPGLIGRTVTDFAPERRPDLWSGVGLAATYAGVAGDAALQELCRLAKPHGPELAQGSAFAAKARERAGNLTEYTERATRRLCGLSAIEAARLCDSTLENLPATGPEPAYEVWRKRIQTYFARANREVRT
jgi:hypothetical protein